MAAELQRATGGACGPRAERGASLNPSNLTWVMPAEGSGGRDSRRPACRAAVFSGSGNGAAAFLAAALLIVVRQKGVEKRRLAFNSTW